MKTAVTVINTVQTGMDNYKDIKTTKVFEDSATLLEIKQWIKIQHKSKIPDEDISIGGVDISDVPEPVTYKCDSKPDLLK